MTSKHRRKADDGPRGDRASYREPQRIGDVLTDLLARRGYGQITSQEDCQAAWRVAVGDLAEFSLATVVKRGVLQVVVGNSVVMQELTFRKPELVARMASALPKHRIKDMRFKVGKIS